MIFVSYSSNDREQVEPLVIDLGILGHSVYFEEKRLAGPQRWDEIFENIEQADGLIYTVTPSTQISYSRLLEYEYAQSLHKPIFPVQFEDIDLTALPPHLPPIIDYSFANLKRQAELGEALAQETVPFHYKKRKDVGRPGLSVLISRLYQRLSAPKRSAVENAAILLNLRELLERRETFTSAETLLNALAGRLAASDPLAGEVSRLRAQVKRLAPGKPVVTRRHALEGFFTATALVALFVVVRGSPEVNLLGVPLTVTPAITIAPTATLTNVDVNTASDALVSDAPSLSDPSDLASDPPMLLHDTPKQNQLADARIGITALDPSATPTNVPSATPVPPTATLQFMTNTPQPASVPPPQIRPNSVRKSNQGRQRQ